MVQKFVLHESISQLLIQLTCPTDQSILRVLRLQVSWAGIFQLCSITRLQSTVVNTPQCYDEYGPRKTLDQTIIEYHMRSGVFTTAVCSRVVEHS